MPYVAPPTGPTVGLFAAELIIQAAGDSKPGATELVLALHRGARLPSPVKPSTIDALLEWALGWKLEELEQDRDSTKSEIHQAFARLGTEEARLEPAAVPLQPSVS